MERAGLAWSEYEVATVRKEWAEGKSAKEISDLLPGRTRNAVIGVVFRLSLPQRVSKVRPARKVRKVRKARTVAAPAKPRKTAPRNMHVTRIKRSPAPEKRPNKFDDSPASQAAAALLGKAYKREGLSL